MPGNPLGPVQAGPVPFAVHGVQRKLNLLEGGWGMARKTFKWIGWGLAGLLVFSLIFKHGAGYSSPTPGLRQSFSATKKIPAGVVSKQTPIPSGAFKNITPKEEPPFGWTLPRPGKAIMKSAFITPFMGVPRQDAVPPGKSKILRI